MTDYLFEKAYRVNSYETDASGKLCVPGLFNYLQDIASDHATILKLGREHLLKDKLFWVLSRIMLEMNSFPEWGEEIIIRTQPNGTDKLFALRDFEIIGHKGIRHGGASSCWLMVNQEKRRPVRPDKLLEKFVNDKEEGIFHGRYPGKIDALDGSSYKSNTFPVKYSDLDINMHVNNVQYIKWVLDTYPLDFIYQNSLKTAEINYISESLPGDDIYILVQESDEGLFKHSIIRNNDKKELCRLILGWKQ